jgi:pimeloyl-ACP methyl ester carboxylesterase
MRPPVEATEQEAPASTNARMKGNSCFVVELADKSGNSCKTFGAELRNLASGASFAKDMFMADQYSFRTANARTIAYHKLNAGRNVEKKETVVFLGGFRSDMTGTKAVFLEDWCRNEGRAFLRFDYSGHGASSGDFLDGCIGDWADDAAQVIGGMTEGPVILVGSSMGGWISLLLARGQLKDRVAGLVGVAAAPDFTEDSMWAEFTEVQKREITETGQLAVPSEYSDDPYIITRKLIEDGRNQLVLRDPLSLPFPVRLVHGTADADVDMSVPLRLLAHADCPDMRLTLVKDADHRFSAPDNLDLIVRSIEDVSALAA